RERAAAGLVADRDLGDDGIAVLAGERHDRHGAARGVRHEREAPGRVDGDRARIDPDRDLGELDPDVAVALPDLEHGKAVRLALNDDEQLVVPREADGARACRRTEALPLRLA